LLLNNQEEESTWLTKGLSDVMAVHVVNEKTLNLIVTILQHFLTQSEARLASDRCWLPLNAILSKQQ